ncbi:VWA domain-containing protein [Pseudomonas putida]|uniref:VWFA domain-containing protein n=1 Tax=Pseudomonas putida TaxID=303 RepID=A0A1Q9QY02_PSEPU|nr:VWA domain-containing protein [Pseudomonas putida]OLS59997.1 hypothetical protein PSEMO_53050 [Pseudomonas putida]
MQRVIRDTSPSQDDPGLLEQGTALITRYFPPSVAHLFAIPRTGQDGTREWWSELQGQPQRYLDLNQEQQAALLGVYEQRQGALRQLVGELRGRGLEQEAAQVQRQIGPPKLENLYSVNGQPLVTRWSEPPPPPPPVPPVAEVPPPAPVVPPRRVFWLPWFLLPLLALLLLALLLWLAWPWLMRWLHPEAPVPPVVEPPAVSAPAPEPVPEPVLEPKPEPVPEPVPAPVKPDPAPAAKPACTRPAQELPPEFTVVLDTSGSMNLSVEASDRDEQWFFKVLNKMAVPDPQRIAQITAEPVRIDVAKQGLTRLIDNLDSSIDMRVVTFDGCRAPVDHGLFVPSQRPALIRGIHNLKADDGTALAASLEVAAGKMNGRDRDGVIVMFVDGPDGCDRNVCEVAQNIARHQPRLKVNLVNISRNSEANCVAEATGGRVYTGDNAAQVAKALEQASREVTRGGNCQE